MPTLRPARILRPLFSACVVLAGASAHAQVLRERDLGVNQGQDYGFACANLGDIDGDGVADFIVGSPEYDNAVAYHAGRVEIFSGKTGAMIRSTEGAADYEELGYSVAAAGDVDGDGVPDYAMGAPGHSTSAGAVGLVVVCSGRTGAELWGTSGTNVYGSFGQSVSGVGDVDGDGLGDLVVGADNEVFVLDHAGNVLHHLTNSDGFGRAVAGCGDLDGDGVRDFLVGKPYASLLGANRIGGVIAFSGATGLYIHNIWGTNPGDQLGWSLAPLGDVNGDGVDDYLAGAPFASAYGYATGAIRVVSGAGGGFIRETAGDATLDYHGWSVCGMGDVDGDGIADYAVGAPDAGSGHEGRVRVCSGSSGATIHDFIGVAGANYDLGVALASGDWNGDGVDDLLFGDEFFIDPISAQNVGAVEVQLMCPAWRQNYGSGFAGTNGIPGLATVQPPAVGASLDIVLDNSLGMPTTAFLFVGMQTVNLPLKNSGTLLVAPLFTLALPLPATGLTLNGSLPNDPALYFLDVYLQAVELDPNAAKGFSFTPGLQLHCGFDL